MSSQTIQKLVEKSIAVASGKGGVGKTVTAANLSIYYARKGLRVGLVDLDPLSDLATILDIYDSEKSAAGTDSTATDLGLSDVTLSVFPNIDLLFPSPKLSQKEIEQLHVLLYDKFTETLEARYDVLIFDMPAGSNIEDNLSFLPYMKTLLLVTNPEPTAHVSAGAYIKKVLEQLPETTINVWHNRYTWQIESEFNPRDLCGNYNRNVLEENRLSEAQAEQVQDFAYIPEDPTLNLLHGNSAVSVNIQHKMLDVLNVLQEQRLASVPSAGGISSRVLDLIRFFLSRKRRIDNIDLCLAELGDFLRRLFPVVNPGSLPGGSLFSDQERENLAAYIETVIADPLRNSATRVMALTEERIEALENTGRLFFDRGLAGTDKALDRELSNLLVVLNQFCRKEQHLTNYSALLLFYFSLYKLLQSRTVVDLIDKLIPRKKDLRGQPVRDRHRQIRHLLKQDQAYRQTYRSIIRLLFPVLSKQISTIVNTFGLSRIVFRDSENRIIKQAYLKLLINFLHDTVYSGLSIVVGFSYRPASVAFAEGAEKLLSRMRPADPDTRTG